jgi:hypothetical protein
MRTYSFDGVTATFDGIEQPHELEKFKLLVDLLKGRTQCPSEAWKSDVAKSKEAWSSFLGNPAQASQAEKVDESDKWIVENTETGFNVSNDCDQFLLHDVPDLDFANQVSTYLNSRASWFRRPKPVKDNWTVNGHDDGYGVFWRGDVVATYVYDTLAEANAVANILNVTGSEP